MSEDSVMRMARLQGKAQLLDEFPPDESAINVKLQALALRVEAMSKLAKTAAAKIQSASYYKLDAAIQELESATNNHLEALQGFAWIHTLIRDFVPSVRLLSSWQDYARRYHEQVESKKT